MKRLDNVLYVSQPDVYVGLQDNNAHILKENKTIVRVPLNNLAAICTFGRKGVSPALMAACMKRNISITFFSEYGEFQGRVTGESNGNVILRKTQYRMSDCEDDSVRVAQYMIVGKIYNAEQNIKRLIRNHSLRLDVKKLEQTIGKMVEMRESARTCTSLETLRGIEGHAAHFYFRIFDDFILRQKEDFVFRGRNRRPPLDRVNALLSFAYTLLTSEVSSALEGVGLDAYVGFLHRDRPGRVSLALDVMEELRPVIADRFVVKLINLGECKKDDFFVKENGAVLLKDEARQVFLKKWQAAKEEQMTHPFLKEKIKWGLVPHVQSLLLARYLRGDLDAYPPLLIK